MLINGDCLEEMKNIPDKSVDLIFCDLPYGQTSCKWDCPIDLDIFWKEIMRIKIINAPVIMTTTTKFGVSLIQSAPKKCPFRYDLIWCKSAPCGFLSAKKMPMRKHEMIYVFYEKLPFYDLSSHKHKFIKERDTQQKNGNIYEGEGNNKKIMEGKYDPPLPTSLVKEEPPELNLDECNNCKYDVNKNTYGGGKEGRIKISKDKKDHQQKYDPPLPTSLVKDIYGQSCEDKNKYEENKGMNKKERKEVRYDPPLPTSLVKENNNTNKNSEIYGKIQGNGYTSAERKSSVFDPPLPNSLLEIKSTRGKHSTEKPVALIEWILKYYSKEGDTVLDPTMGSGSTGVACKNMNRKFIGIEMDKDIYDGAVKRLSI